MCKLDGVAVIASILNEANSQMRKYAVSVLAQLAMSLSGQIAMMSDQVLARVIEMLKDPMPNVANAACYCLLKVSTLFIGAQILVSNSVISILTDLLYDPESILVMKTRCAATLLQIYRFIPQTSKSPALTKYLHTQLKSPDKNYKLTILQLLDQWGEELPQIPISSKVQAHIKALQANLDDCEDSQPCYDTRITGSTYLMSDLAKSPEVRLELVEAGGVEAILENAKSKNNQLLPRYSFNLLSIIADSNFGRKKILRYRVIDFAVQLLNDQKSPPLLLFSVARFLEVCAQHKDTGAFLLECSGVSCLLNFLEQSRSTTVPPLSIHHLLLLFTDFFISI